MPRKVSTEPIRRLTVELPVCECEALENYCLEQQVSKRQVIRSYIRTLKSKQSRSRDI
ncbi:MAG: CopG family transcriptional regulator [Stigonema ocellatum SAG 48.90 = DSM 106950]|nr:CopG family transcriptional regulator [Stigonema ocellatum SAG 48.90 = DSM 106950]